MKMTGDAPSQNVHFRTACDPCSTAKVRCDKTHPSCNRCLQIKAPCSYSKSRKHGKQSWRKKPAYDQAKAGASTAPEDRPLVTAKTIASATTSPGHTGWSPLPSGSMAAPSLEVPNGQYAFPHNTALLSWAFGDGLSGDMDVDAFASWDVADLSSSALQGTDGLSVPGLTHSEASPGTSGSAEVPSPEFNPANSTHDCEARAISILRSMQHGQLQQGATSCSSDPTRYADLNLTPRFDHVLATNKAALNGWSRLMECTCAQCPHLILLYVSILSKMLFWYRIAASEKTPFLEDGGAGDNDPTGGSNATNTSSPQDPPTVDQFGVQPTVIQVGMLPLDAEDQASLRRVLLLRELRRTERAIDELMTVDRTGVDEHADEFVRRAVQWSLSGISRIREELQDLIQKVVQIR
ncbi:hypothetical protein GGS23DRAFT_445724 [Durotheca rogersii]|uniref:uncharacterized protein n=1 Tax=Durotheca rogersii TaxID=419775 RepID=UPI0022211937|nr:uncharacterized protein GGS23DRAFT_445724 [Durotheca rogersii]KAI5855059.1 hypothetical protein GGS23DRAFT_445724 [Durotheca rogersii]